MYYFIKFIYLEWLVKLKTFFLDSFVVIKKRRKKVSDKKKKKEEKKESDAPNLLVLLPFLSLENWQMKKITSQSKSHETQRVHTFRNGK